MVVPFDQIVKSIPINMRQYVYTLAGGTRPLTERDLSPDDFTTLKDAVIRKIKQTGQTSGVIGYGEYDKDGNISEAENTGTAKLLHKSFTDPVFRLESTLGMVRYTINKNGEIEIHDSYDFNADRRLIDDEVRKYGRLGVLARAAQHSGIWGVLNAAGNMAKPDGTGTPFVLNLGQLDKEFARGQ